MIQINGTIKLRRTIDASIQKSLVEMVRASRAEDGCLDYSFARDLADPDTLVAGGTEDIRAVLVDDVQAGRLAVLEGGDLPPRRECAPLWHARLLAPMAQKGLVGVTISCNNLDHEVARRLVSRSPTEPAKLPARSCPTRRWRRCGGCGRAWTAGWRTGCTSTCRARRCGR